MSDIPLLTHHHWGAAVGLKGLKDELSKVEGFNAKAAVAITNTVGSMWTAYVFSLLALLSLPAVLSGFHVFASVFPSVLIKASVIALVAWIAQTFLQLVLLPIILVGQNVQNQAADARAAQTYADVEEIKATLQSVMDSLAKKK